VVTLVVADDEADMRLLVRSVLELSGRGFKVIAEAIDGHDAVERFFDLSPRPPVPHVVVLDNRMPNLTGLQTAERMLADTPDQIVVLYSAYLDDDVRAEAARIGVAACVSKTDIASLPEVISHLVADEEE
jgi:two-component system chemotaxis response regulator CheY